MAPESRILRTFGHSKFHECTDHHKVKRITRMLWRSWCVLFNRLTGQRIIRCVGREDIREKGLRYVRDYLHPSWNSHVNHFPRTHETMRMVTSIEQDFNFIAFPAPTLRRRHTRGRRTIEACSPKTPLGTPRRPHGRPQRTDLPRQYVSGGWHAKEDGHMRKYTSRKRLQPVSNQVKLS